MDVYYNNEIYGPSSELKFRLKKLAEIAALAKLCNQDDLFEQAKNQYNSLANSYNSIAETKKKGFWGQFLDNLTNTRSDVVMVGSLESSTDYSFALSSYKVLGDYSFRIYALNKALEDLKRGY